MSRNVRNNNKNFMPHLRFMKSVSKIRHLIKLNSNITHKKCTGIFTIAEYSYLLYGIFLITSVAISDPQVLG